MAENGLDTNSSDLTRDGIESIEEPCDLIDLAYDRNIPLDGCESLDDMKERFLAHLFPSPSVTDLKLENIKRENTDRRNDVANFVGETLSVIQSVTDLVNRQLSQEEITNDVESDLKEILSQVTKQECYILVSGETNAGKSTLLNLLLGEEILPNSILSCTATITKIRYATHYRVEVRRDSKTSSESASFNDAQATLEFLEKLNDPDNRPMPKRDTGQNVIDVELFCPAPILKSGVVLVDTPGVGENDQMDEVVGKFVARNRIAGFVYVIMSDHEGGVQEDRLIKLMKMIIKKQSDEKTERTLKRTLFDPKSALFICNRWDLIPEKSVEIVRKHTLSRLQTCWPDFEEPQVYFFSTKRSLMHLEVDVQYITREYSKLLQGLKLLFSKAMNTVASRCHKWLEYFLQRTLHHIRTIVKRHNMSEKVLENQFSVAKRNFDQLRRQSDDNIMCLRRTILREECNILEELKEFLSSDEVKVKFSKWNRSQLPNTGANSRNWHAFKKNLDDIVWNRLGDILGEYEKDTGRFDKAIDILVGEANTRFALLEGQLKVLENEMSGSDSIEEEARYGRRKSILQPQILANSVIHQRDDMHPPTRLPIKILSLFSKNIAGKIENIVSSTKISQYERNPEKILFERSQKVIKSIIKNSDESDKDKNALRQIISGYLSKPNHYLEALEKCIPNMIASNMSLMDEVKEKSKICEEEKCSYQAIFTSLEKIREKVLDHGFSYYPPKELTFDDIVLEIDIDKTFHTPENSKSDSSGSIFTEMPKTRDATTLWTVFRQGYFHQGERKIDFTVRTYLPSVRPEHMYEEVQRIRFLNHRNVAEFIGTLKTQTLPAYIFYEHVVTARRYLKRQTTHVASFVPGMIEHVAGGLEYLHTKRLTHMELTLDSIMINGDGIVKLCGGCLPRVANLPMEKTLVDAGNFVYLSPEVLNGEVYGPKADVYSFALIVIETYTSATAFRKEKQWSLCDFSANVDPCVMINLERFNYLPDETKRVLLKCIDPNPEARANVAQCKQIVKTLKDVKPLFRRSSGCKIRKSPSAEEPGGGELALSQRM